jgi:uncharacterized protein YdhG (YjbR/CyaY superfamily)
MKTGESAPGSVDAYIARFTPEVREALENIRSTIRKAAPGAEEKISYMMPAFVQDGPLVYFAAFKSHIGFFPTSMGIVKFKDELAAYETSKGTVRFPLGKPIPYGLIARIVKFRVKENLARAEAKRKTK